MRFLATFVTLVAVALAAPQGFEFPSDPQPKPGFAPAWGGFLNRIVEGLQLPQLAQQIESLLNSIETLLPKLESSQLDKTPAGGLVASLLLQVRAILVNTLARLEKAPNAILNRDLINQLTSILGRVELLLNDTLGSVTGSLQGVISGVIGEISGIIEGPVIQLVPDLLTRVLHLLRVAVEKLG
ncbi:uncharacterized protein LOC107038163 [Diachasma alloeum]|uniref:uncharacterized protein LOC107038163 n=1 Tax=Diachasma alloeum TaxID=454923 RepID=UPI00073828D6|nr:uncharacterized protein LOC107038163 [Diachasma alloeum]